MRYCFYLFGRGVRLAIVAVCVVLLVLLPVLAVQKTVFRAGEEYTFYIRRASSQAEIVHCPAAFASLYRFFLQSDLTGESTVYAAGDAGALIAEYGGVVLFTEETAGVLSYYCYSPLFAQSVTLQGAAVNLHLAERADGSVCIGTPIIFGGY